MGCPPSPVGVAPDAVRARNTTKLCALGEAKCFVPKQVFIFWNLKTPEDSDTTLLNRNCDSQKQMPNPTHSTMAKQDIAAAPPPPGLLWPLQGHPASPPPATAPVKRDRTLDVKNRCDCVRANCVLRLLRGARHPEPRPAASWTLRDGSQLGSWQSWTQLFGLKPSLFLTAPMLPLCPAGSGSIS